MTHEANPGYAQGQIAKALQTAFSHPEPEVRAAANRKVNSWESVFTAMLDGTLRVGSRTPLAMTPSWVTLKVLAGGFATQEMLAAGPAEPHEVSQFESSCDGDTPDRGRINRYYLSDAGLHDLRNMLASGCYRINVPEEGALLVVAWLLENGHQQQARDLLDQIGPFMSRLRFYPVPSERPELAGTTVRLQPVSTTVAQLGALKSRPEIEKQREAVLIWAPLKDKVVALFSETYEEGWPCQVYPEGWADRAKSVLAEYSTLREKNRLCGKPDEQGSSFRILRYYLHIASRRPENLTGRDVGLIRKIIADFAAKRGLPGSESCEAYRKRQCATVRPGTLQLAAVLIGRLSRLPQSESVSCVDDFAGPVTAGESERFGLPQGTAIPPSLREKLLRCQEGTLQELIDVGVIPSSEVLATVVPQVTSQVAAAALPDAQLQRVYAAIYRAFRRRRSLLLLNLESQVRLEELPWVKAMLPFRSERHVATQSLQVLEEVVVMTLVNWPHQIIPNKLIQELDTLVKGAGVQLPLTNELATDIFMGTFSPKFQHAAKQAVRFLRGTPYECYYRLPTEEIMSLPEPVKPISRWQPASAEGFAGLVSRLAGKDLGRYGSPAVNGKVVEWQQILTTHNLAGPFELLNLRTKLATELPAMARRCFQFVCKSLQQKVMDRKTKLQTAKDCAYAWRQMIFFVSMLPENEQHEFMIWATGHQREQREDIAQRLHVPLIMVGVSLLGMQPPGVETCKSSPQLFLGWTTEREHWLFEPVQPSAQVWSE